MSGAFSSQKCGSIERIRIPSLPRSFPVRIRLVGTQKDVDLASEVMCVVFSVAAAATYPSEEYEGQIVRYLTVQLNQEALTDQGLLLAAERALPLSDDALLPR
jgi:hypothetical protein